MLLATCGEGVQRTASAQAIVQQDLCAWQQIWHRLGDVPSAPWRTQDIPAQLTPLIAGDITRASRSFSARTSIGCDAVPPAAMADLSEPLKEALAMVLNEAE